MDPSPDQALIARLRKGEASAFDQVYGQYCTRLYRFLLRLTQSRPVSEDLLQETWLRFASQAPHFSEDTPLGPWLFRVARNLAISHLRWRRLDLLWRRESLLLPRASPKTPQELVQAGQTELRIEKALELVPILYREVLLLVGVEQLLPEEACQVLGISPQAYRQRLSRARKLLTQALQLLQKEEP